MTLRKKQKILAVIILIIILTTACTKDISARIFPFKNENVNIKLKEKKAKTDFKAFKGLNMKSEEVKLAFEGKPLNLTLPIYNKNNRLYIPVTEVVYLLGGEIVFNNDTAAVSIKDNKVSINMLKNSFRINNQDFQLKQKAIKKDGFLFLSLFDFTKMFQLKTVWNIENRTLGLFYNKDNLKIEAAKGNGKPAFVRLEDICAGQRYATAESLEKLRIVSDYLYKQNIPFHVAWVPRYIEKSKNIDNNLLSCQNLYNSDFIFTLDYFLERNGIIGLHGYTHQHGSEASIDGTEFNGFINSSEKEVRERVELAVNTAKVLEIPVYFFESPHYAALEYQKRIMGQYFDYIYEGIKNWRERNISKVVIESRTVKFIPTSLGYVDGAQDTKNVLRRIERLAETDIGSFFYHPNIEFDFIQIKGDRNGYPNYNYDNNSPLHNITNKLRERGYIFKAIREIE